MQIDIYSKQLSMQSIKPTETPFLYLCKLFQNKWNEIKTGVYDFTNLLLQLFANPMSHDIIIIILCQRSKP